MIERHFCNDRCVCNNSTRDETLRFIARDTVHMDELLLVVLNLHLDLCLGIDLDQIAPENRAGSIGTTKRASKTNWRAKLALVQDGKVRVSKKEQ